jgi:chromosome partitioning protein
MIIGICSNKGGSGKSTTAIHLVYWLNYIKQVSAVLIDVDAQATSSEFLEGLNYEQNTQINYEWFSDIDDMTEKIVDYVDEYDVVVVDCPGNSSESTRSVVWISDLIIIPIQHTAFDEKGAISTLKLVKSVQEHKQGYPIALGFISRVIPNTQDIKRSLNKLQGFTAIKLLSSSISQKVAVGRMGDELATVWHMKSAGAKKAQSEYQKLFEEVTHYIK